MVPDQAEESAALLKPGTIKRIFSSPFQNARWVFWLIVTLWLFLATIQFCREDARYLEVIVATLTICAVVWSNHVKVVRLSIESGPSALWLVISGFFGDFIVLLLTIFVCALPIFVALPTYSCGGGRANISEIVLYAAQLRSEIDERAANVKTLSDIGHGMTVPPFEKLRDGFITQDGVIILLSNDPVAAIVMTPKINDRITGKVEWTCRGMPIKLMPAMCRP